MSLRRPTLTFLGAAGTVTGSRFLVRTEHHMLLVDVGMFQGEREWRRRNWEEFPVDPASIDTVVLSHAHLDHTGYLPVLVKQGFAGRVLSTPDTATLTSIVLRDAAHLQEEDAAHARDQGYSRHRPPLPLFDAPDAEKALTLLDPVPAGTRLALGVDVAVTLRNAGHILGSSFTEVEAGGTRLVFSGDLGRQEHPLLEPPAAPGPAHVVVVESTYGDRSHERTDPRRLAAVVRRTINRRGVVLLPAFAVDRTPVVLSALDDLRRTEQIPDVPVFVDSPMALAALEVYRAAIREGSPQVRAGLRGSPDPWRHLDVRLAPNVAESEALNRPASPCIIVSASGMATGGRVLHHLAHQLPDARNAVVLTGFQVVGTRGRSLLDGEPQIKIHGRYVPVHAEVVAAPEFSAHADADEIVGWLGHLPSPPQTAYVVHGELTASQALAGRMRAELGWTTVVPRYLETVRLDRMLSEERTQPS
jgi:metallo-beta-lactamase family protein